MGWFVSFICLLIMGLWYQTIQTDVQKSNERIDVLEKMVASLEDQIKGHKRGL